MNNQKKHICVCICTYKRSELLNNLLLTLEKQKTEEYFNFSIVIVDNDKYESAKSTVERFAKYSQIVVSYYVEPEQSIAFVRNKAIKMAEGDFVALIDDDEYPESSWLLNLYKAIESNKSDGILGPVFPYFEEEPPKWILKGKFFDRPTHPSGHVLSWYNTRTGNALIKRSVFEKGEEWFDPKFGSGGEDIDFFRRMIINGFIFIWCNEAFVYEVVPPNRWKRSFMIKRALLRGRISLLHAENCYVNIIKSLIAVPIYSLMLPFLQLCGHHFFMQYLIKLCDHAGKLLALIGLNPIREREM